MKTHDTTTINNSLSPNPKLMLLACIAICEATGILSALLAGSFQTSWFENLAKPSWFPPPAVFGPVWTVLYLLMGIALWLVWKQNSTSNRTAELFFATQLFLNFWWSIIFFRFHAPGVAYADILLMIVMVVVTMVKFSKISRPAMFLLLPYLVWIIFASFLNLSIWLMNS
ncbi:MAG TPA: TspO/MBR family protein [Cyclobacteriaceae bacterium]|nr:TspO/MBR family protein [Cyclobacteriaceae bacterium]